MKVVYTVWGLVALCSLLVAAQSSCDSTSQCEAIDNNSECVGDLCECKSGFYNDTSCQPIIGSECTAVGDCVLKGDSNTQCPRVGPSARTCICKNAFFLSETTNLCTRGLGSSCDPFDDQCNSRTSDSNCVRSLCECRPGYFEDVDECTSIVGSSCSVDDDCLQRGDEKVYCNPDSGQCYCKPGFFRDTDDTFLCTETYGTECADDQECQRKNTFLPDNNARCVNDSCACANDAGRGPFDDIFDCRILRFGMFCMVGEICKQVDENAVCDAGTCQCNSKEDWNQRNDTCVLEVQLGNRCDPSRDNNRCVTDNAECVLQGSIEVVYRCQCISGYIPVELTADNWICARRLSTAEDELCKDCIDNRGRCYDRTGDDFMDGCQCPNTRSGADCEVVHVKVNCTKDEMHICYSPHADFNLTTGEMYAERYKHEPSCRGELDTARCGPGMFGLSLPLEEEVPRRCGMLKVDDSDSSHRFQTRLVVQNPKGVTQGPTSRSFDTYCRFVTYMRGGAGVGIGGWPGGGEGEDKDPRLTMYIRNTLGEIIPRGVALRVGDKIKLDLFLFDETNTYDGIQVQSCLASSEPILPHPEAVVLRLVDDGCPSPGQEHITPDNNFARVGGQPNHLQTGLFSVFRLSKGQSLFLHCQVTVCTDESSCRPRTCTRSAGLLSGEAEVGRVRRADGISGQSEVSLVGEIIIYNPDREPTGGLSNTHVIIIGVLAGAVLVAIVLIAVIATRKRRGKDNPEVYPPDHLTDDTHENRAYSNYPPDHFRLARMDTIGHSTS